MGAEKAHRPHLFSLFIDMGMGKPDDGDSAVTAKPLAPSGYVGWPGFADRRYTGRHLPPADGHVASLSDKARVVRMSLLRSPGVHVPRHIDAVLLPRAMFIDSFLRIGSIGTATRRTTKSTFA